MNQGCSLCTTAVATSFCCCSRTETLLCQACIQAHFAKGPGRLHQVLPLQAFGPHKAPGYIERLQQRTVAIESGKATLLSNLEAMDRCIADVTQKVNEVIQVIWDYGQTTVAELTEKRRKLEESMKLSIAEAEGSLYEDTPNLQTPLSGLLREYTESNHSSLQLFSYAISPQVLPTPLPSLLTYSLSTNPAVPDKLVRLYKDSLLILDVLTGVKQEFHLPVSIYPIHRYCLISSISLILVGGKETFFISLSNADISKLQPPNVGHFHPGMLAVKQEVYVFGGNCSNCEKLSIDLVWSNLPNMRQERHAFSPCLYEMEIYLASSDSSDIEIFSLNTASFRLFPISYPAIKNNSISFIFDKTFTIITCNRQKAELDLGTGSSFVINTLALRETNNILHSHSPVVIGKKVYWFSAFTGDLTTYDIETKTLTEESVA